MADDFPQLPFASAAEWEAWLEAEHARAPGVWVMIAKKASGIASVTQTEAIDVALCYGWIDGRVARHDDDFYGVRFTPRRPRSNWSRINKEKVAALIAARRMRPAGLAQVEAAKADGRWEAS